MVRSFILTAVAIACVQCGVAIAKEPSALQTATWASSCLSCHGPSDDRTTSNDIASLWRRDAQWIITRMQAFTAGTRESTVMGQIAKGYEAAQLAAIAAWFSAQSPKAP